MDFEYATEITDQSTHGIRTVSPASDNGCNLLTYMDSMLRGPMATEVDMLNYRYTPTRDISGIPPPVKEIFSAEVVERYTRSVRDNAKGSEEIDVPSAKPEIQEPPVQPPAFFRNALHDLESILWIAIWFLTTKRVKSWAPVTALSASSFDLAKQQSLANRLFYNRGERTAIMLTSNHFASCIKDLHPAVQGAARILDRIRDDLVQCYYEAEKDLSAIGKDVAEPLYVNMNQQLFEAAMELKKYGVVVKELTREHVIAAGEAKQLGSRP